MKARERPADRSQALRQSLEEYGRGVAGGLLFSLPLIYTMEVWWAGFLARPSHLLLYFFAGFSLLFAYNRYSGLRQDASWREVAFEAVEEMGIGLLLAALLLWLLGQVHTGTTLGEALGKVVVEGVTAAIGVSVGSAQLGGGGNEHQGMANGGKPETIGLPGQIALATCGAVLFASNVAPTEEIVMIAVEASAWKVLGLALLSLALSALILFYSDFRGSDRATPREDRGLATVLSRVALHYTVALVASAFILWFFGRFDGASPAVCLAQTVVLGVASSLGASVGRLLLQPSS
jgi:putative integral membrane protein (TIGR02587 family)